MSEQRPKFDVISIGDTQYDVFLELDEETKLFYDIKEKMQYLGLVFAEKIPVKSYVAIAAVGNSANFAIGASRLGLKSAFYTHLGYDHIGKEEFQIFKKEKVAADYLTWDRKRESNFSAVLNYKGERTILVHHERRDYNLPKLAPARWVYFSSLAPGHDRLHRQIPLYIKKTGAKLGFNPGTHQLNEGLQKLKPILTVSAVFLVNKEEAQTLLGNSSNIKKLLRDLKKEGPQIVVITDNGKGSYCFDGKNFWHLPIFKVNVVEMTGAGDAYSTGFICGLAYGKDVKEAMRWGAVNAASVVQYIGAREGLLHRKALEQILKKNSRFQPKHI